LKEQIGEMHVGCSDYQKAMHGPSMAMHMSSSVSLRQRLHCEFDSSGCTSSSPGSPARGGFPKAMNRHFLSSSSSSSLSGTLLCRERRGTWVATIMCIILRDCARREPISRNTGCMSSGSRMMSGLHVVRVALVRLGTTSEKSTHGFHTAYLEQCACSHAIHKLRGPCIAIRIHGHL
jgi:hypothetical protein